MTNLMAEAETIDTSGSVDGRAWSDLSPFAQGYIAAALESIGVPEWSRLAPEALALILSDCETAPAIYRAKWPDMADAGRALWRDRQQGILSIFGIPPLRVYLDDAGNVRLSTAEAQ